MMSNIEQKRETHPASFSTALTKELIRNVYNCYGSDNWEVERFGKNRRNLVASLLAKTNALLKPVGITVVVPGKSGARTESVLHDFGDGLSFLYSLLEDSYSKVVLSKVIAYRILGHHKMKLPLNAPDYWVKRKQVLSLIRDNNALRIRFRDWSLSLFELDDIGYPLKLYSLPLGIATIFVLNQYVYGKSPSPVKAQEGDCVIDAGGCWGDTALFFAHEVGAKGRVYTFECVPENLEIMERNLQLNPELKERVEIIRNPLWSSSHLRLSFSANGPASKVSDKGTDKSDLQVTTLSIDDFVASRNISKIDLIKMDIEGAELSALKGATNTVKTHNPKLAISVYHSLGDFVDIPCYLSSLGVKYHYYLKHPTIYSEETVLFATPA